MTKNYFIELADFNIWANNIVHSWFDKITDEQWEQPVISSFNSLAATSIHTAGAEIVWLERLNKITDNISLASVFKGSKKELLDLWIKASQGLKTFVENVDETKLQSLLWFKRFNGVAYEQPHYQVLAHVFNHSTYHRGQIVTMLRQTGFTDLASTDMTSFFSK